jgi:hypothetical protein
MAKSKQPSPPEKTLEELLDKVSNAREDLLTIERSLERLRDDIAKDRKPKKKILLPSRMGGPFKPGFGLSGAVLPLHKAFPPPVHVFAPSAPTRSRPVPR